MGPIQSNVNQISNMILHSGVLKGAITAGKKIGAAGKTAVQGIKDAPLKKAANTAAQSLSIKPDGSAPTQADITTHLESVERLTRDPVKAQEFLERHPEIAEQLIGEEAQAGMDAYIRDTMSQIGNIRMAEEVARKAGQREAFTQMREAITDDTLEQWGSGLLQRLEGGDNDGKE